MASQAPEGQRKDCPMDPYMIIHSKCQFVDHQTMKLQEAPDMVPVGELPKHMLLSVDRWGLTMPARRDTNQSFTETSQVKLFPVHA